MHRWYLPYTLCAPSEASPVRSRGQGVSEGDNVPRSSATSWDEFSRQTIPKEELRPCAFAARPDNCWCTCSRLFRCHTTIEDKLQWPNCKFVVGTATNGLWRKPTKQTVLCHGVAIVTAVMSVIAGKKGQPYVGWSEHFSFPFGGGATGAIFSWKPHVLCANGIDSSDLCIVPIPRGVRVQATWSQSRRHNTLFSVHWLYIYTALHCMCTGCCCCWGVNPNKLIQTVHWMYI